MSNIQNRLILAKHLHSLGLNLCSTSNQTTEYNFTDPHLLKAPANKSMHLFNERQTLQELEEFDWANATGIGVIVGFNELAAIDLDLCVDDSFLSVILDELSLPQDYAWVVKSGSRCGYHLLFYCSTPSQSTRPHKKTVDDKEVEVYDARNFERNRVSSFYPRPAGYGKSEDWNWSEDIQLVTSNYNKNYSFRYLFERIEFCWDAFLVLPSSLHRSGHVYDFVNGIPNEPPLKVSFDVLKRLRNKIASQIKSFSTVEAYWQVAVMDTSEVYAKDRERKYLFYDIVLDRSKKEILQIGWIFANRHFSVVDSKIYLIRPDSETGYDEISRMLGISRSNAKIAEYGIKQIMNELLRSLTDFNGHVITFDNQSKAKIVSEKVNSIGLNYRLFSSAKQHFVKDDFIKHKSTLQTKLEPLTVYDIYYSLFEYEVVNEMNALSTALMYKMIYQKMHADGLPEYEVLPHWDYMDLGIMDEKYNSYVRRTKANPFELK